MAARDYRDGGMGVIVNGYGLLFGVMEIFWNSSDGSQLCEYTKGH